MLTLHPPPHCLPSPSPTAHLRYSPHIPGAAVTMATASLSASGTRDWHAGISSTPIYLILPGPKSVVWEDLSPETQSLYFKPRVPYMGKLQVVLFLSFYWNLCVSFFTDLVIYLIFVRSVEFFLLVVEVYSSLFHNPYIGGGGKYLNIYFYTVLKIDN